MGLKPVFTGSDNLHLMNASRPRPTAYLALTIQYTQSMKFVLPAMVA